MSLLTLWSNIIQTLMSERQNDLDDLRRCLWSQAERLYQQRPLGMKRLTGPLPKRRYLLFDKPQKRQVYGGSVIHRGMTGSACELLQEEICDCLRECFRTSGVMRLFSSLRFISTLTPFVACNSTHQECISSPGLQLPTHTTQADTWLWEWCDII
jgi:hypothetical protein